MTPEQHDLVIDQLFKRINMRGDGVVVRRGGEEVESGWLRLEQGLANSKPPAEHPDPFQLDIEPDHS